MSAPELLIQIGNEFLLIAVGGGRTVLKNACRLIDKLLFPLGNLRGVQLKSRAEFTRRPLLPHRRQRDLSLKHCTMPLPFGSSSSNGSNQLLSTTHRANPRKPSFDLQVFMMILPVSKMGSTSY